MYWIQFCVYQLCVSQISPFSPLSDFCLCCFRNQRRARQQQQLLSKSPLQILQVLQKLRMERILSIAALGKTGRLSSPKVQRMEIHQSQEKSIKLLPAPRDPLQTARTSLRLTNLFLQLTAQQNAPRRSVPTGLLTQLTISETMRISVSTRGCCPPPGTQFLCSSAPGCSSCVCHWVITLFTAAEPVSAAPSVQSEAEQQNPCCSSRLHSEMLEFLHKNSPLLLPSVSSGGGGRNSCSPPC
ncbi:hypothetical protein Nmel_015165 [Mimus melanotis]